MSGEIKQKCISTLELDRNISRIIMLHCHTFGKFELLNLKKIRSLRKDLFNAGAICTQVSIANNDICTCGEDSQ